MVIICGTLLQRTPKKILIVKTIQNSTGKIYYAPMYWSIFRWKFIPSIYFNNAYWCDNEKEVLDYAKIWFDDYEIIHYATSIRC